MNTEKEKQSRHAEYWKRWSPGAESAMWVPDTLDCTDPEGVIFRRYQDYSSTMYRWKSLAGEWVYAHPNKIYNKRRPVLESRHFDAGTLYDDHPATPSFQGVDATEARWRYEARRTEWEKWSARYRAAHPEGEDKYSGITKFDSLVFDPIAHSKGWFGYKNQFPYGVIKPRKNEWFWFALAAKWDLDEDIPKGEGFTDSEESAIYAAQEWFFEYLPHNGLLYRDNNVAKNRYKEHHARKTKHKDWVKTVTGTVWEHRRAVWTHYDSGTEWPYGTQTWTPRPIVNITEKFIYVLSRHAMQELNWRGTALNLDQFTRNQYIRLSREELEAEGSTYHHDEYHSFYSEPLLSSGQWEWVDRRYQQTGLHSNKEKAVIAESVADMQIRVKDLRRIIQKEHPDKGGSVEKFMQARADMEELKQALRSTKEAA